MLNCTNKDEDYGYEEGENIASNRFVIAAISFAKELNVGIKLVIAERLKDLGCRYEGG